MRAGMNPSWLKADGKVIALNLGADFTAEHEMGINDLKRNLGMDGVVQQSWGSREKPVYTKPYGIERRIITRHELVKLYVHGDRAALICYSKSWHQRFDEAVQKFGMAVAFEKHLPHDLRTYQTVATAWDEGSFGVYGVGEEAERIKDLAQAFESNNIAIWIGGRQLAFDNGGLILCVVDRTPADCRELLRSADEESEKLKKASDATGIIERLKAAGRGYFACMPRFRNNNDRKSAHPVVYWLNPMEQDQNNFGWFSVEDLDQWIAGKGVVPKEAVKGTAKRSR